MERSPFYSVEMRRNSTEFSEEKAKTALAYLNDPDLRHEIGRGNATIAMIRPKVGPESNLLHLPDQAAADEIEMMIEGLGVMAKFSIELDKDFVKEFYRGGPETSMLKEAPQNSLRYENRWPEFVDFMASGPTTVLILHSLSGDAIEKWRSHLGHWNIDEIRDPSTIRGRLGVNKYNNLVHGSDSVSSALRELSLLSKQLEKSINSAEAEEHVSKQITSFRGNLSESQWLENIGVISDQSVDYRIIPFNPWKRLGGESYELDFSVVSGQTEKHLVAKACVKIPPAAVMEEWLARRQLLIANDIPTPTLYQVKNATLLEEFIPYTLGQAYRMTDPYTQQAMRKAFSDYYTKLHDIGFRPLSLHDLRSRGDDIVFIDFGEDLGGKFDSHRPKGMLRQAELLFDELIRK